MSKHQRPSEESAYAALRRLLILGYAVEFRPTEDGVVRLEVMEASGGIVDATEVDMHALEWGHEQGVVLRLREAEKILSE